MIATVLKLLKLSILDFRQELAILFDDCDTTAKEGNQ